jgi:hypothetical protein
MEGVLWIELFVVVGLNILCQFWLCKTRRTCWRTHQKRCAAAPVRHATASQFGFGRYYSAGNMLDHYLWQQKVDKKDPNEHLRTF